MWQRQKGIHATCNAICIYLDPLWLTKPNKVFEPAYFLKDAQEQKEQPVGEIQNKADHESCQMNRI